MNTAQERPPEAAFRETFAREVDAGLQSSPRVLPSKYFYDAAGNRLFQRIMHMPEYYLTNCEYDVFTAHRGEMLERFSAGTEQFRLIEFGAGDGLKTRVLLEHFLEREARFTYTPIDISAEILEQLGATLRRDLPGLNIRPMACEYFQALSQLPRDGVRNVVLFLGSNIGNFDDATAGRFLGRLGEFLNAGDLLMVGMDLKKHPEIILEAYNDPHGITRDFNLNLLHRMNRELGADFQPQCFAHWPVYDPLTGMARSYLVSLEDQTVSIEATGKSYRFRAWESIHTETSRKYDLGMIEAMSSAAGFSVDRHFTDKRNWFVDSLWRYSLASPGAFQPSASKKAP